MIKKFLHLILILIGSLIIFLAIMTSTEFGLRVILKIIPGEAHAEEISGSLLDGWEIRQLQFKNNSIEISSDYFKISWRPKALLHKQFSLGDLELKNAVINLNLPESKNTQSSEKFNKNFSLPKINLPINIDVNKLNLSNIKITTTNHKTVTSYQVNHFLLAASANNNLVTINQLLLNMPSLVLTSSGTANIYHWGDINLNIQVNKTFDTETDQNKHQSIELLFTIKNQNNKLILTANTQHKRLLNSQVEISQYLSTPENMSINANWSLQAIHQMFDALNIDGEISSSGKITGKLLTPTILINLNANKFNYQNISANQFTLKLNTALDNKKPIDLAIYGNHINIDNKIIENLNANINGTLDSHKINLAVNTAEHRSLKLSAQGGLNTHFNQWDGDLSKLDIKLSTNPLWQLVKKTPVTLSEKNLLLNNFCLTNHAGNICTDINKNNNNISTKLTMRNIDLSILELWLDNSTKIKGKLNADFSADYDISLQQAKAKIAISTINTVIKNTISHQIFSQNFPSIKLNSTLDKNGLAGILNIHLPKNDYIKLDFSMPEYYGQGTPSKNNKISSTLDIRITDLNIIKAFTDSIEKIKGTISSDLQLSGTISKPLLSGGLYLNNGKVKITPLGIKLNPIKIAVTPKNNKTLEYQISLGQKNKTDSSQLNQLMVTGSTELNPDNNFKSNININSENFLVVNTGEYNATIAPQLNIIHDKALTQINGDLTVLSAKIAPIDFSSTVTLPSDVVYVNSANQPIKPSANNLNLLLNIALNLKDINFDYKGLKTNLEGQLKINKTPKTELNTRGSVKLNHGSYQAYGQDLTLAQNGRLIFNGDASNPQLNLAAYKEVAPASGDVNLPTYQDKLIVGIKVTGTADKPIINFYSIPAGISDQNILSYIIFGFPQNQLSGSQTAAIWQALSMLGPNGDTNSITNFQSNLKKNLGLTELGFSNTSVYNPETAEVESGTSFVVGKRITDKLSLTYNMGIAVPVNVLYLRYQLSSKWTAQTDSSSLGNGADIFYIIQRN